MTKIPTVARVLALTELSGLPPKEATAFCDAAACLIEQGQPDTARLVLAVVVGYHRADRAVAIMTRDTPE